MQAVEKARRVNGMTQTAAAAIANMSLPTYRKAEVNPTNFTIQQLTNLAGEFDEEGQQLVWEWLTEVYPKNFSKQV